MTLDHPAIVETQTLHWPDEAACAAFAQSLAAAPGIVRAMITLNGPLGAGKTTFVRHLLRALGVKGRIKSPTYALVESHHFGAHEAHHLDLYRMKEPQEWLEAGLLELLDGPGLKLVEWAEKARGTLPAADLQLSLEPMEGDARLVRLQALTPLGQEILP
jgi:tRNA threonylcarbamoyladenosine biosynthesis protein TsaE